MNADELLRAVVAKLNRGDCDDRNWPDAKGEYWALCPYHGDDHCGNFSVSLHGCMCLACNKSGGLHEPAQKLGVEGVDVLTCCSVGNQTNLFLLGREVTQRYHSALTGDKFRWAKGSKAMPYGLWKLDRAAGYAVRGRVN